MGSECVQAATKCVTNLDLIWFECLLWLIICTNTQSIIQFLKSHWLHYEIDYVDIDKILNNEQNSDTVWLHALSGFTGVIALFELNLSYNTF